MGLITDFFKGNMSASPSRKPRICTLKARRNAAKQRHASAFFAARRAEERYKKAMRLEESLLEEANQARAHDQLLRERREKTPRPDPEWPGRNHHHRVNILFIQPRCF